MRRNIIIILLSVVLVGTWILSLSCFGGVVRDLSFLPEVNEKDGGVVRPLPYDAEVEWLESTGTQYIITSTELSAGMIIGLTAQVSDTATGGYKWFFGQYGNGVARYGWYSPTPGEFSMLAQGVARIVNPQDPTKKFSVTGVVNGFSGKSVNVGIFGCSEESTVSGKSTKTRVFNFSVQNNDEILCDLIPVRFTNERGETEGAMYDKVSGQLFRNQGTGAFIIGPDVRKVSSRIALNSRETMP